MLAPGNLEAPWGLGSWLVVTLELWIQKRCQVTAKTAHKSFSSIDKAHWLPYVARAT